MRYEKEEREREKQRLIDEENAKKKKKKNKIAILSIIGSVVLLIIGISVGINIKLAIDWHNSDTYKLNSYLDKNGYGYKDGVLSQYIDIEERGKVYFNMEYVKDGWRDSWNNTFDYRVTVVVPPKTNSHYKNLQSSMCFNLSGSNNKVSFITPASSWNRNPSYSAKFIYDSDYAVLTYDYVSFDSSKNELTYKKVFYSDTRWDEPTMTYMDEWKKEGWVALSSGYLWINDIYNQATGKNLYK